MLIGFGDDSADESQQRVFAVAGVIGKQEAWDEVEQSWLAKIGSRPFHATDCDSDQGEYRQSSHRDNKRLYRDLVEILAGSNLYGCGFAIPLEIFRGIFPAPVKNFCFYMCLDDVLTACARLCSQFNPPETFKLVFDWNREIIHSTSYMFCSASAETGVFLDMS